MDSTIFRNFVKWAVFLFFWLAGTGIATAAEYYVSTTGNDSTGNGAVTTPYQTIQHVLDNVAASGDTITLRGGTYNENVRIRNANLVNVAKWPGDNSAAPILLIDLFFRV